MCGQFGDLKVDTGPQASTQVGGTSENVSDVLVEHKLISSLLAHQSFYLQQSLTEPGEHLNRERRSEQLSKLVKIIFLIKHFSSKGNKVNTR